MQPQRLVEFGNRGRRQLSKTRSEASDVNRPDLLCLSFGRACQPGGAGLQQRLKGQNVCHVGRHWYDGHHTTSQNPCPLIRSVIADDYYGPPLVGLRAAYRL